MVTKPAPTFAAALVSALKAANMSQSELARRVGCGRSVISEYAVGNKLPRRGMLDRINAALGTNLSPTRPITIKEVARDLRASPDTIRRGFRGGQLSALGVGIPSPRGKRHRFIIFPERYRELVNANA